MTDKKAKPTKAAGSAIQKTKTHQTKKKKTQSSFLEMGEKISAVLLELMCSSESDSVRVAAAKALMDRLKKQNDQTEDTKQSEQDEALRTKILGEAREILAAFERAKSGCASGASEMDPESKA